ncbi:hypothetical protein [Paenibacillus sp. L3-i20]|nr:hypothetical protein [Paenibacillus sp. L3-i20]GKU76502.1 hypothetical protein L3i20_v208990 [Paenibacillus sp. L3-i20]
MNEHIEPVTEGVAQGGLLNPISSNIVQDELDKDFATNKVNQEW